MQDLDTELNRDILDVYARAPGQGIPDWSLSGSTLPRSPMRRLVTDRVTIHFNSEDSSGHLGFNMSFRWSTCNCSCGEVCVDSSACAPCGSGGVLHCNTLAQCSGHGDCVAGTCQCKGPGAWDPAAKCGACAAGHIGPNCDVAASVCQPNGRIQNLLHGRIVYAQFPGLWPETKCMWDVVASSMTFVNISFEELRLPGSALQIVAGAQTMLYGGGSGGTPRASVWLVNQFRVELEVHERHTYGGLAMLFAFCNCTCGQYCGPKGTCFSCGGAEQPLCPINSPSDCHGHGDCSMNGKTGSQQCVCKAAFRGQYCERCASCARVWTCNGQGTAGSAVTVDDTHGTTVSWVAGDQATATTGYTNNANCSWTLAAPQEGLQLRLRYNMFILEEGYDFLSVSVVGRAGAAPAATETLTGAVAPGMHQEWDAEQVRLLFLADYALSATGFNISFEWTCSCPCGQVCDADLTCQPCGAGDCPVGTVADCFGHGVCASGVCQCTDSDVDGHYAGPSCGACKAPYSGAGCRSLEYSCVPNAWVQVKTDKGVVTSGTASSPFGSAYEHDLHCQWALDAPVGAQGDLDIHFISFNTEESYDTLEVVQASNGDNYTLGIFSGSALPTDLRITAGAAVYLIFRSDGSVARPGFKLAFQWACSCPCGSVCDASMTCQPCSPGSTCPQNTAADCYGHGTCAAAVCQCDASPSLGYWDPAVQCMACALYYTGDSCRESAHQCQLGSAVVVNTNSTRLTGSLYDNSECWWNISASAPAGAYINLTILNAGPVAVQVAMSTPLGTMVSQVDPGPAPGDSIGTPITNMVASYVAPAQGASAPGMQIKVSGHAQPLLVVLVVCSCTCAEYCDLEGVCHALPVVQAGGVCHGAGLCGADGRCQCYDDDMAGHHAGALCEVCKLPFSGLNCTHTHYQCMPNSTVQVSVPRGEIVSATPSNPFGSYNNYLKCRWDMMPPTPTSVLLLVFRKFDTEPGYDFLIIEAASATLSGNELPQVTPPVPSYPSNPLLFLQSIAAPSIPNNRPNPIPIAQLQFQ